MASPLALTIYMFWLHWQQGSNIESNGDKVSSSAECRSRPQCLSNRISSRLNTRWKIDWAIEDKAKALNSTVRHYNQRAFSPLDPTTDITCWCYFWSTGKRYKDIKLKWDKLVSSAECRSLTQGLWKRISRISAYVRNYIHILWCNYLYMSLSGS